MWQKKHMSRYVKVKDNIVSDTWSSINKSSHSAYHEQIEYDFLHTFEKDNKLFVYNYWMGSMDSGSIVYKENGQGTEDEFMVNYKFSKCLCISASYDSAVEWICYAPSMLRKLMKVSNKLPYIMIAGAVLHAVEMKIELYIYYVPKFAQKIYAKIEKLCKKMHFSSYTLEAKQDEKWSLFETILKPSEYIKAKAGVEYILNFANAYQINEGDMKDIVFLIKVLNAEQLDAIRYMMKKGGYNVYKEACDDNSSVLSLYRKVRFSKPSLIAATQWIVRNLEEYDASLIRMEFPKNISAI